MKKLIVLMALSALMVNCGEEEAAPQGAQANQPFNNSFDPNAGLGTSTFNDPSLGSFSNTGSNGFANPANSNALPANGFDTTNTSGFNTNGGLNSNTALSNTNLPGTTSTFNNNPFNTTVNTNANGLPNIPGLSGSGADAIQNWFKSFPGYSVPNGNYNFSYTCNNGICNVNNNGNTFTTNSSNLGNL